MSHAANNAIPSGIETNRAEWQCIFLVSLIVAAVAERIDSILDNAAENRKIVLHLR